MHGHQAVITVATLNLPTTFVHLGGAAIRGLALALSWVSMTSCLFLVHLGFFWNFLYRSHPIVVVFLVLHSLPFICHIYLNTIYLSRPSWCVSLSGQSYYLPLHLCDASSISSALGSKSLDMLRASTSHDQIRFAR